MSDFLMSQLCTSLKNPRRKRRQRKIKLYELSQNFLAVQSMLDNPEHDITMLTDTLDSLQCAIEEKAQGIAVIASEMTADIGYVDSEIKRLQARKRSIEGNVERLKDYMQTNMQALGMEKIKTPTHTIAIRQNPASLVIDDAKALYAEYLTIIPQTVEPNKQKIKDALKAGKEVPGARLTAEKRLEIR